jgi:enamine deaminase RidA (YjgF/YER057c/UK114 family)
MKRTPVNHTTWNKGLLQQGEIIEDTPGCSIFSGQVSVEENAEAAFGIAPKHPGDMRAQMGEALASIDTILAKAGMNRGDLIHLRFFVADMAADMANIDVYVDWIGATAVRPTQSFLGIDELVMPELMIEIEATAATAG